MLPETDPRHLQIAVLGSLALWGSTIIDIGIRPQPALAGIVAALFTQLLFSHLHSQSRDWRSPLISALSLAILLRTEFVLLGAFAGALAVASKYLIRWRGQHFLNPSALAIAALVYFMDEVWIAPGQWGNQTFLALLLACCGVIVLSRSRRLDTSLGFLAIWSLIVLVRNQWLGDPLAIAVHQLGNGALLLFAFFMISDPKSTPVHPQGRLIFVALVAMVAAWMRFGLYQPEALIYALVCCAPIVPILNNFLPADAYQWRSTVHSAQKNFVPLKRFRALPGASGH